MKILVLYGSPTRLSDSHVRVRFIPAYYVRAEVSREKDLSEAVINAKALPGETVLNAVGVER